MREIKCRAKRIDNGELVYGSYVFQEGWHYIVVVEYLGDGCSVCGCPCVKWHLVDAKTVGQYTGLKDKNGKEIYEGGVVAFEDSDGGYEYPDVVVNTGVVEYGELRFYFTNRVAAEMDDFYIKDGRCDDVEVIGNIHENPELLGV